MVPRKGEGKTGFYTAFQFHMDGEGEGIDKGKGGGNF